MVQIGFRPHFSLVQGIELEIISGGDTVFLEDVNFTKSVNDE